MLHFWFTVALFWTRCQWWLWFGLTGAIPFSHSCMLIAYSFLKEKLSLKLWTGKIMDESLITFVLFLAYCYIFSIKYAWNKVLYLYWCCGNILYAYCHNLIGLQLWMTVLHILMIRARCCDCFSNQFLPIKPSMFFCITTIWIPHSNHLKGTLLGFES